MDKGKMKGILVGVAMIVIIYMAAQVGEAWSPTRLRDYIEGFGIFAPLFFLLLSGLRPVFFVPASVIGFVGGLLFGLWGGAALAFIGALLAASLGYFMAQYLGGRWIEKKMQGGRLLVFRNQLSRYGFYYVLFLRLIPMLSFDLISYICGFAQTPFLKYIIATAIGVLPGTMVFTLMGSSVAAGDTEMLLLVLGAVLLLLIAGLIYYAVKRRSANI
ncbi:TVP38/TMEM64 family protein [Salicibibacter halophilus]|uniref:TVP38/TMEM64 family membrane protein n=1 Tax=Salicibibacter halophilus TaxID=2502791 RepID=A0A514LKR6_9BACI|nr:VTT domain-containing protein [Salicibibacter halophilus]QDI92456.1 TVP38/TMEM64 family protein [Salicibibacter halophilus]